MVIKAFLEILLTPLVVVARIIHALVLAQCSRHGKESEQDCTGYDRQQPFTNHRCNHRNPSFETFDPFKQALNKLYSSNSL